MTASTTGTEESTRKDTTMQPRSQHPPAGSDGYDGRVLAIIRLRDRLDHLRQELVSTEDLFVAEIRALAELRGPRSSHP